MEEKLLQPAGPCRIAVTGPESTGKSVLAESLALHYHTVWVPEYARTYLKDLDRPYHYEDILKIARGQLQSETEAVAQASGLLFCDTELIVTKIWSEFKYGKCDLWIPEQINQHPHDLYLLCDIDLPWEFDPLREHPGHRKDLFRLYLKELESRNLNYGIVSGTGAKRLENALSIIKEKLKIKV